MKSSTRRPEIGNCMNSLLKSLLTVMLSFVIGFLLIPVEMLRCSKRLLEAPVCSIPYGVQEKIHNGELGLFKILRIENVKNVMLYCLIALAGGVLQGGAVEDVNAAARIFEDAEFLQIAGRDRNGRPVNAQHHRQELMGELQLIAVAAVVRQQQPSREAFIECVVGVAGSRLRHLRVD